MTEYIEREAVLRDWPLCDEPADAYQYIQSYPAADVRPVVLCKDCQNSYEWANVDGDNYRYCGYLRNRWNPDNDRVVDDDDFCVWGRKKSNCGADMREES